MGDLKITLRKGVVAFALGGVAALIPFFQGIQDPQLLIYIPVIVSILTMTENYLKHLG